VNCRTHQQDAFHQEVGTSDLGGKRRKRSGPSGKHLGKGWEAAGSANEHYNRTF